VHESKLVIEPLGPQHDRASFTCGELALDTWFRQQAGQDMRRGVARVFVAVGQTQAGVAGYYSLSAASFQKAELPSELSKRLPHYPVPAAIIGRLAVASDRQGQGIGEVLLLDAIRRVLHASGTMAVYAVVVEAKNDRAASFYRRYGFRAFASQPLRLFLPLETVARLGL
jgi:ribosomal protein S18 acetylase RimI-like enzyme